MPKLVESVTHQPLLKLIAILGGGVLATIINGLYPALVNFKKLENVFEKPSATKLASITARLKLIIETIKPSKNHKVLATGSLKIRNKKIQDEMKMV